MIHMSPIYEPCVIHVQSTCEPYFIHHVNMCFNFIYTESGLLFQSLNQPAKLALRRKNIWQDQADIRVPPADGQMGKS